MRLSDRLKTLFDPNKWTDKSFIANQLAYKSGPSVGVGESWEYFLDENGHNYFKYESAESSLKAYRKCPPVTAIINKKAKAFTNGKTWVLNTQGKAKGKEATSKEAQLIKTLFNQPNPLQSGKQFEAQNYIYQQLCGYVVVLPIRPVGFKDLIDTTALWNIPPHMVEIKEKRFKPYQINKISDLIESITLISGGERTQLNVDEVIVIKDFTPSFDSPIIPDSRIKSLELPINNIIGAYESRNVLINQRGPRYAISSNKSDESGNIPLTAAEKDNLQKDFRKYGLRKDQVQAIITAANISITPIGFSTRDLMLFEELEGSTMALCDNFDYPYRLMSAEKSASYNDVSEFKKQLYQDATIPEANSIYEQWDALFKTAEFNIKLDKDFSHVAVLQEDEQKKATARNVRNQAIEREWRNGMIKLNEWRVMNGDDPMEDDRGNMYFPEYVALYGDPQKGSVATNNENNNQNGEQAANGKG